MAQEIALSIEVIEILCGVKIRWNWILPKPVDEKCFNNLILTQQSLFPKPIKK